jgi:hypothetical protein
MNTQRDNKFLIPGQCEIISISIESYNGFKLDIRNHFAEIVINESMDHTCISGYVQIVDNLNLLRHVPLIGNEIIDISFSTPSRPKPVSKKFFYYKVDNRFESVTNKGAVLYQLHFVSEEFITAKKKKISLALNDLRYSDMIKILFANYCKSNKKLFIQPTFGKKNLIIPYMNPFQAIDMICKMSLSDDVRDKSYIFYEDLDNFCFCNINHIAKRSGVASTYSWGRPGIVPSGEPTVLRDLAKDFKRIESYKVITANNTINNIENGLFASMMLLHDSTFKSVDAYKFSYNDDFYQLNTINEHGILTQRGDTFSSANFAHYRMYPRQSYAFSNIELNDDYDKTILHRNAHLAQMENSRLTILIPGDSDRRIGEMVNVNIPAPEPLLNHDKEIYDKYLSGSYVITQITHIIQKVEYKMRLFLERDSLPHPYPEQKETDIKL